MVRVLVKTPEGQQAGPISRVEHLVDTLLGLVVHPCLELGNKSHVNTKQHI